MAKRKTTPLISGSLDLAEDPVVAIGHRILRESRADKLPAEEACARVPRGFVALRAAAEKYFGGRDPELLYDAIMDAARQARLGEPAAFIRTKLARDHGLAEADVEAVIEAATEFRAELIGSP